MLLRVAAILLAIAVGYDLYTGGKYLNSAQQIIISILHHLRAR
jgi:hypothetical protein